MLKKLDVSRERMRVLEKLYEPIFSISGEHHFSDWATSLNFASERNGVDRVSVQFYDSSDGSIASTDGSKIFINRYLNKGFLGLAQTQEEAMYLVVGMKAHELGHILFSPRASKTFDRLGQKGYGDCEMRDVFDYINILEDGFIEYAVMCEFPGIIKASLQKLRRTQIESFPSAQTMFDSDYPWKGIVQNMTLSFAKFGFAKIGKKLVQFDEDQQKLIKAFNETKQLIDDAVTEIWPVKRVDKAIALYDYWLAYFDEHPEQDDSDTNFQSDMIELEKGEPIEIDRSKQEFNDLCKQMSGKTSSRDCNAIEVNIRITDQDESEEADIDDTNRKDSESADAKSDGSDGDGEESDTNGEISKGEKTDSEDQNSKGNEIDDDRTEEPSVNEQSSDAAPDAGHQRQGTDGDGKKSVTNRLDSEGEGNKEPEGQRSDGDETDEDDTKDSGGNIQGSEDTDSEIDENDSDTKVPESDKNDHAKMGSNVSGGYDDSSVKKENIQDENVQEDDFNDALMSQILDDHLDAITEKENERIEESRDFQEKLRNSGTSRRMNIPYNVDISLLEDIQKDRKVGRRAGELLKKDLHLKNNGLADRRFSGNRVSKKSFYDWGGRVFSNQSRPGDPTDLVVGLLIDCSGSMKGFCESGGIPMMRITHAIKAAAMMYGLCEGLGIRCSVTGFNDNLWAVCDFVPMSGDFERLTGLQADSSTGETEALIDLNQQLNKRPEKRKLVFIIGDGAPDNSKSVKSEIADMEKKGYILYAFGIGYEDGFKNLYGNRYVAGTEVNHIASEMVKRIKKDVRSHM